MSNPAGPTADSSNAPGGPAAVLGWATYLGCSWTWCIGMFLPILLVRDYGLWGFLVFAVPNVIGAAAMGWTLRDASASRRFVENNPQAVYLFSVITIAFHAFWLTWLATWMTRATGLPMLWFVPAIVGGMGLSTLLARDDSATHKRFSVGVWLFSIGVLAAFLLTAGLRGGDPPYTPPTSNFFTTTDAMSRDLLALAPVCVFGFALCPYLDATFHRARQGTSPAGGRAAFTIGFGVCFASMIGLTLLYAGPFVELFNGPELVPFSWTNWAAAALVTHLALQLVFTVKVHYHASLPLAGQAGPGLAKLARVLPIAAALLAVATIFYKAPTLGLTPGELAYRCFISAYGLVLPAYVWVCAIPTRDGHSGLSGPRGRFKLAVLAIAVLIATPMYFVGYIMLTEWWLWPGLAVLLLARLPVMLTAKPSDS